MGMVGLIPVVATRNLGTKEDLKDVLDFFKGKDTTKYDQKLAQSVDGIKANIAWLERDEQDVREWLMEKGYLK